MISEASASPVGEDSPTPPPTCPHMMCPCQACCTPTIGYSPVNLIKSRMASLLCQPCSRASMWVSGPRFDWCSTTFHITNLKSPPQGIYVDQANWKIGLIPGPDRDGDKLSKTTPLGFGNCSQPGPSCLRLATEVPQSTSSSLVPLWSCKGRYARKGMSKGDLTNVCTGPKWAAKVESLSMSNPHWQAVSLAKYNVDFGANKCDTRWDRQLAYRWSFRPFTSRASGSLRWAKIRSKLETYPFQ